MDKIRATGVLADYVDDVETGPAHDDGDLTRTHGFLPRRMRTARLPERYEAWEDAAESLTSLAFGADARTVLGDLPMRPAGSDELPTQHLKRAATLLGMIAHSYWRFGLDRMCVSRNRDIPDDLPDAIADPWAQVCRRLGRALPSLTIEDWVFNNFVFKDRSLVGPHGEYDVTHITNTAIEPLIPAFGNEAERVFTSSFVDIHAAIAPTVSALCKIDAAMRHGPDGAEVVAIELGVIAECVRAATLAFRRVSPRPGSDTYCDPVDWAKTLVTWTVPPAGHPCGPSGSATPLVHMVDAVIGRSEYGSSQGAFAREMRASQLARKHALFCDLVQASNIRGYVNSLTGVRFREVAGAFDKVVDAFAGPAGFLGVHKGKVVNYLGVGTIVGRNQSTAHDQTYVADSSWTAMADRLADAIRERDVQHIGNHAGVQDQPESK